MFQLGPQNHFELRIKNSELFVFELPKLYCTRFNNIIRNNNSSSSSNSSSSNSNNNNSNNNNNKHVFASFLVCLLLKSRIWMG